ncbi:MAG: hypothetical protein MUF49_24130 [Oculatellaceae cyanobacterium Prado106]|jgi:hypothetical protein|nr:hypothetical protein [Oculatellaceae cyanobacterium Prado106]
MFPLGSFTSRNILTVSTAIALGLLVVSCSENKASQCNKLIGVANQAVQSVEEVTSTATPDNIDALNRIATAAEQANQGMRNLSLGDQELRRFQERFVAMYDETNRATRALVAAAQQKDAAASQTAFEALKTATDKEAPLVDQVNQYCNAGVN